MNIIPVFSSFSASLSFSLLTGSSPIDPFAVPTHSETPTGEYYVNKVEQMIKFH